ncbi:MAG TPA: Mur ligase family protein [Candidatus Limnocylindrales bacterium]|nr:Mur ligase family protein [Candidatus Limnocylindrales bacterium]
MRLIEIRLLEGPNVYRLEPVAKVEVALGRRRTWYGRRDPEPHMLVRLAAVVPAAEMPSRVAALVGWIRRLRREHPDGASGPVLVHRSSDPGHWIVTWPWAQEDRAKAIADAALSLVAREISPERRGRLAGARQRAVDRAGERIAAVTGAGPAYIRDADRRLPVVSISGTNGKTTTTRLTAHILREAGKRVGMTTSDGIVVDGVMVEQGDWTGFGGARQILTRDDIDIAVLETARGGILLRGVGYESNEASVVTNVSSDHLDLQGIHTLPELAEVKSTIARITKPSGWVVLNADDRHVAGVARRVRGKVAFFTMEGDRSARVRRHLRGGGRAYLVRDGVIGEADGDRWRPLAKLADVPVVLGGIARHNVANALAAAGAARAMGATLAQVAAGLRSFRPTTEDSRGRLNVFRDASRVFIVDFAHNEAGVSVLVDVAEAIAGTVGEGRGDGKGGRALVTFIVGLAGDRPDDTLRGVGRQVASRTDRFVQKEMLHYLRGRTRESVLGEIRQGAAEGGWTGEIPLYIDEPTAVSGELDRTEGASKPEVIVLLCHEDREGVYQVLAKRGLRPVNDPSELARLVATGG